MTASWGDTHWDHQSVLPIYVGDTVVGEATNFAVNGRHNTIRACEVLKAGVVAWHDEDEIDSADESGHEYLSRVQAAELTQTPD